MTNVIIFDLEFTSWEGFKERRYTGPGQWREVVQIGALEVDARTFEIGKTFDVLVKPVRNPILSDFFIQLTGITQAQVEQGGLTFPDAFAQFQAFRKGRPIWAYGRDADILAENCGFNDIPVPDGWPTLVETNLHPWFRQYAPETNGINSGRLVEVLGLRSKKAEHTGLGDCYSIAESIKFLVEKRGIPGPFPLT